MKGRRFPSGDVQKQYWKNWSTRDDLRSLAQWEELFGPSFRGLFVFAYDVLGDRAPLPAEELFQFRGSLYGFIAVPLSDYAEPCPSDLAQVGHLGDAGGRFPPFRPAAGGATGLAWPGSSLDNPGPKRTIVDVCIGQQPEKPANPSIARGGAEVRVSRKNKSLWTNTPQPTNKSPRGV